MRKALFILSVFVMANLLSGCATYKFQRSQDQPGKGYIVSRDGRAILEYTSGKDKSTPEEISIAQERFKRRRKTVEYYYKKMGYIQGSFMEFWNYPVTMVKLIWGQLRLPFIAISNYKYDHNPKYREKMDQLEKEKDEKEEARLAGLKEALNGYVEKDIVSEGPLTLVPLVSQEGVKEEPAPAQAPAAGEQRIAEEKIPSPAPALVEEGEGVVSEGVGTKAAQPEEIKKTVMQPAMVVQPKAVIIAKPLRGFSPLRVKFYGHKSHSPGGKIVSYLWDFGDEDTSTNKDPVNTYYSTTFEPRYFTATLTVTDAKGNTASSSIRIEVLNK